MHSVLVRFGFLLENIKEITQTWRRRASEVADIYALMLCVILNFQFSVTGLKLCVFFFLFNNWCLFFHCSGNPFGGFWNSLTWIKRKMSFASLCLLSSSSDLSLSLLLVLCFRGGGWQGFAALPQPALLQGLSGPRPPANHQRQPLPPHCSLWVHITLYRSPLPPSGLHHCCTPLLFLFLLFFDLILSAASLYVCNCLFHSLAPFLGYHCQPSSTS